MCLGEMSFAAGAYADAVAHYEQLAAKGYPDAYRAGFNLTLAYVNTRNYAAAIRTGAQLARELPTAELHSLWSRDYEAAGPIQQAYDSLRSAAQIDPKDERNYIDLMALCMDHENWGPQPEDLRNRAELHYPARTGSGCSAARCSL
jgi:tetratricopeptide (TPR) repeat protein